jgi:hypothetical protein
LGFVATCVACGTQGSKPSVEPLSPQQPHYGKSYAEWAAAWVQWVYQWPETTACPDPIADQSGSLCDFGQDPSSPVFFLTGNWGGVTRRTDCVVPADKALLVPIITTFQDNGAVPEANQKTDADLRESAIAEFQSVSEVHFVLDGHSLDTLGPYAIVAAPYEYTLPPEPNVFTCQGSPGVTGSYSGYTSGYFVLLPPLAPGAHTLAFTARQDMATSPPFTLDVAYSPATVR